MLLLWMDTETTGLLDDRPTVLETAWMVTDSELRQLTPLRQRLCAIHTPPRWWEPWKRPVFQRLAPSSPKLPAMPEAVRRMHEESWLAHDWNLGDRLCTIGELDDLMWADVVHVRDALAVRGAIPVHLAGAGVAQFEARLLPLLGSELPNLLHYRTVDSSVATLTLGQPKYLNPDPGDGLEFDIQAGVNAEWATTVEHRAATDVRIAYRAVRDLRRVAVTGGHPHG